MATARLVETINKLEEIEESLAATLGKDAASDLLRAHMLEPALNKLVGGFEHLSRIVFEGQPGAEDVKVQRTDFQKPKIASNHFEAVGLKRFEETLDTTEWATLIRYYQQRHVMTHCDGLVDADYIKNSGDRSYEIGQRLVVKPENIQNFVVLLDKLAQTFRAYV